MSGPTEDDDAMFVEQQPVESVQRERASQRGRAASVAVVMMQRDEAVLLDPWLRYHVDLFGAAGVVVLDNGSTDRGVLERLERAQAEGVRVIRDHARPEDAARRGAIVTEVMQGLAPQHDFLMPLDCAEFVAHQAPDGRIECRADPVLNHLSLEHRDEAGLLLIRGAYLNIPGLPGFYVFKNQRRCFFAAGALGSLGNGYHEGQTAAGGPEKRTAIIHFHYRFPPFEQLTPGRRQALDAPAKDYAAEGLRGFRGAAAVTGGSFATMDKAQYEAFFRRFDRVPLSPLRNALRRLGCELPW